MENMFDDRQYEVIRFNEGRSLVLSGLECDMTRIQALRVLMAHQIYGISYNDMLCLTNTNRAQRQMQEQIRAVAGEVMDELSVISFQSFCLKFLLENHLIPHDIGIVDEYDLQDALMEITDSKKSLPADAINKILENSSYLFMRDNGFEQNLWEDKYDSEYIETAQKYAKYKEDYRLIDSEDILLLTYSALNSDKRHLYKNASFRWMQVDETLGFNSLQLDVIDLLSANDCCSVMFWVNEQQRLSSLASWRNEIFDDFRNNPENTFFDLSESDSTSKPVQNMLVDYATCQLGVKCDSLPNRDIQISPDKSLVLVNAQQEDDPFDVVSAISRNLLFLSQQQAEKSGCNAGSTCILVRTDNDADEISEHLEINKNKHIKLSKRDAFRTDNFKTICSHFSVVADDIRYSDWIRILYQTRVLASLDLCRRFVKKTRELCLSPVDLMNYDCGSYFINFCESYKNKEIVVLHFDSTHQDFFSDDIKSISAIKIRNGEILRGTELAINISEHGEADASCMPPQEGFERFLRFVGKDEILSYDGEFDIHLLEYNIKRRTSGIQFEAPVCWSTLKMSRKISPDLNDFTLQSVLHTYGLEKTVQESMEYVWATIELIHCFYGKISEKAAVQKKFIGHPEVMKVRDNLRANYMPLYKHTACKLFSDSVDSEHSIDYELGYVYDKLRERKYIGTIRLFPHLKNHISNVLLDSRWDTYFYQQLVNCLYHIRLLNESDLIQNNVLTENLFVMTIDKAKGMEFDNVVVYNTSYNSKFDELSLYDAMSKAKKMLYITYDSHIPFSISKNQRVMAHFRKMSDEKIKAILQLEEIAKRQKV